MTPSNFRQKPNEVTAFQFTEELRDSLILDDAKFPPFLVCHGYNCNKRDRKVWSADFRVLKGLYAHKVDIGDWVVLGENSGEVYSDAQFKAEFEPVIEVPEWDGVIYPRLQEAINALRFQGKFDLVNALEFEIRESFQALWQDKQTFQRMYRAAQKQLEKLEGEPEDPFK